jgi:hypothetical protein
VSQAIYFKEINSIADLRHHVSRSRRVILGNPRKDTIQVVFRRLADNDLHMP